MTNMAASGGTAGGLSARMAIRLAWLIWLVLLAIPFLFFLGVVWTLSGRESAGNLGHQSQMWFLTASVYLLVVVPVSFFWRGHVFKAYWSGKTVAPGKYLFGMISVWLALEIGGIFSLVGCKVNDSLLPNLLPALVAFMFFVTLWPSGRAMVRTVGAQEDPQFYEEPR
jgi:hypothetical protein